MGVMKLDRKFVDIASKPGFIGSLARFWQRSYAADYVCLILVGLGWIAVSSPDAERTSTPPVLVRKLTVDSP